jgi:type IV fimbrial biogenesis protein FimT
MQQTKKNQGFTLIELIVTIAVMAIIAMMAAPSFGDLVARKQLDTIARDFALIFGETRGQAISLRKPITLKLACPTETDSITAETKVVCPANTATSFSWISPRDDIELTSDAIDVVFSGLGTAKQREKLIDNPVCNPNPPVSPTPCDTNPADNPRKIPQIVPLEFTLCNVKIGESRTIHVSKVGTVDAITTGTCS